VRIKHSKFNGDVGGSGPAVRIEFGEYRFNVRLHSPDGDTKLIANRLIAQALGKQMQHFDFPLCQGIELASLRELPCGGTAKVIVATRQRADTGQQAARRRCGQQKSMDTLLGCVSNRMVMDVRSDNENAGCTGAGNLTHCAAVRDDHINFPVPGMCGGANKLEVRFVADYLLYPDLQKRLRKTYLN
jgi:hypothetical protein